MKCEICGSKIGATFLEKVMGSYVKDEKGKKRLVCSECQKKFRTKQEILSNLK